MTDNTRRTPLHELVKPDAYISPNRILQTKYAESFNHFRDQVQFNSPMKSGIISNDWSACYMYMFSYTF